MGQAGTKHEHLVLGYQERLDEMQAAFLRIKLRQMDDQLAGRRRVAARYQELLADTPLQLPAHDATGLHAYYQYTVLAPRREELQAFLERRNIQTQIMYPKLVPDQGAYQMNPWRGSDELAVARSLIPRVLCLPMFAELTDDEVERVGVAVREFYGG
jgi:dTDP-4-amino-4,6-dideoxygalactose transaminase